MYTFPVPVPKNGDDFDATPVGQLLTYLLGALNSYDLANVLAGSLLDTAFAPSNSPLQRYTDMFGSFITAGGLSTGFSTLSYTVPSITAAYFQSNGKVIRSVTGQTFTAAINSDVYVSVTSLGVIAQQAVANNAAQPALPSADAQWLQRVVTNGTTITRIDDLRNLTPLHGITPSWQNAVYQNSWIDFDAGSGAGNFGGLQYHKDFAGFVHLRGLAKSGTVTAGTVIATLPVGFRPASGRQMLFEVTSNDARGRIDIANDGTIKTGAGISNAWVSFANIHFRAEG